MDRGAWIFNHLLSQAAYGPGSRVTRLYVVIKDMFNQVKAAQSEPWSTERQRESVNARSLKPLKAAGPTGVLKSLHLSRLWSIFNAFCSYLMCHLCSFITLVISRVLLRKWRNNIVVWEYVFEPRNVSQLMSGVFLGFFFLWPARFIKLCIIYDRDLKSPITVF